MGESFISLIFQFNEIADWFLQEDRNMYAVVATGGKQYKVEEGDVLRVEKLAGEVGSEIAFDKVLIFSDGENVKIGQPDVDGVTVHGQIVAQGKSKKILVFKYKRRKRYRRKQGHRQAFTAVRIDRIEA
jgi:large subunit ribosomal protein L21